MARRAKKHTINDPHLAKNSLGLAAALSSSIEHKLWDELDERRAYARDIIHEIKRDGCVRGELS